MQDDGCSCDLTKEGWLAVIALALLFLPLAWVPCVMPSCRQVRS